MAGLKPIRRVVTGNNERGQSKVVWDGPAPNAHAASMGVARGHTELQQLLDGAERYLHGQEWEVVSSERQVVDPDE